MEVLTPFIAYGAALTLAAAIPGPGVAALVGQSLGMGFRASLPFIMGIAVADLVYLTAAIVGLAALAQAFAGALMAIKVLGALYLVYLAYRFWTSKAGLTRVEAATKRDGARAFITGFAVTMGNPKAIVFYLALLPAVVDLEGIGMSQWFFLAVLTVGILFAVLLPYAALAAKARLFMARSGALLRLNRVAALTIGGAGAIILVQALLALGGIA
ncbi:LysE family translocator [uncultured Sulfitobacter sp.]|uniref:LysE family translocator n=1 Tax=uncultured Sulfitobacter sp. TaxID=191468 RepID=UPI002638A4A7|nr:LysE family translocator [uncultured Sulfitobacter sp.]